MLNSNKPIKVIHREKLVNQSILNSTAHREVTKIPANNYAGVYPDLKEVLLTFMNNFNADDLILTSRIMTSYWKINIASQSLQFTELPSQVITVFKSAS